MGIRSYLPQRRGSTFYPGTSCVWECLSGDLSRSCVCIASAVLSFRLCACLECLGTRGVQEEEGTTEEEMAGWHHRLDGHEFEWTLGVGDGQGGLVCCDSWGCKELDTTEWLNWTDWFSLWCSLPSLSGPCVLVTVMSNSLWIYGLWPARLLCPWISIGQNTRVGCHSLLQGIFPTQGLNPCLLNCR